MGFSAQLLGSGYSQAIYSKVVRYNEDCHQTTIKTPAVRVYTSEIGRLEKSFVLC